MIKIDIKRRRSVIKGAPVVLGAELTIALKGFREALLEIDSDEKKADKLISGIFVAIGMNEEDMRAAVAKVLNNKAE